MAMVMMTVMVMMTKTEIAFRTLTTRIMKVNLRMLRTIGSSAVGMIAAKDPS